MSQEVWGSIVLAWIIGAVPLLVMWSDDNDLSDPRPKTLRLSYAWLVGLVIILTIWAM